MTTIQGITGAPGKITTLGSTGPKAEEQAVDPLFAALLAMMLPVANPGVPVLPLQLETAGGQGAQAPPPTTGATPAPVAQAATQLSQLVAALGQQAQAAQPGASASAAATTATDFLAKLTSLLQGMGDAATAGVPAPVGQPATRPDPLAAVSELVLRLDQAVAPVLRQHAPQPEALAQVLLVLQSVVTAQPELTSVLAQVVAQAALQAVQPQTPTLAGGPKLVATAARPVPEPSKTEAAPTDPGAAEPQPSALATGPVQAAEADQPTQSLKTNRVRAAVEAVPGKSQQTPDPMPLAVRPHIAAASTFSVGATEAAVEATARQSTLALAPERLVQAVVNAAQNSPPGRYSVTVRLIPEHLGEVQLQLHLDGNKVTTVMEVTNAGAQQTLQDHRDQLRRDLDQAGLQLTGFTVTTGDRQAARDRRDQLAELEQNLRRGNAAPQGAVAGATPSAREIAPAATLRRGNRLDTLA